MSTKPETLESHGTDQLTGSLSGIGVDAAPLFEEHALPLLIEPRDKSLTLSEWSIEGKQLVNDLLLQHGALLFRNFTVDCIAAFETIVTNLSDSERLPYIDRSTPRVARADRIYTATTYPAKHPINLHNEGTYWREWPRKLFFYCQRRAETRGETPIANVGNVLNRLEEHTIQEFSRRQVMYVRNYRPGMGLPWQEVFQTDSREALEEYLNENEILYSWKVGGCLQTSQVRPAIRIHPQSGMPVWFNHAAFFNVHALEPDVKKVLTGSFAINDLPYNTYYGDGETIDPEVVDQILDAYRAEKVKISWQPGDVMVLDNMAVAHGREPYTGDREVLVAMTEPYNEPELEVIQA